MKSASLLNKQHPKQTDTPPNAALTVAVLTGGRAILVELKNVHAVHRLERKVKPVFNVKKERNPANLDWGVSFGMPGC
jgi:hypothetical protein